MCVTGMRTGISSQQLVIRGSNAHAESLGHYELGTADLRGPIRSTTCTGVMDTMKALTAREYPHVRLWAKDFGSILYSGDLEGAKQYMTGHDWLNMTMDYGDDWKQRWSGRIEWDSGELRYHDAWEYLEYVTNWWDMAHVTKAADMKRVEI